MTASHLDYETLADLAEGLLDDELATSASTHLAGCDICRGQADEIAEVSRLLAETPTPPMPAELAARLDAAIAAEAHAAPSIRDRHRLRRFQLVAAAAGMVVVGGFGGAALTKMMSHHAADSNAASSAGRPVEERSNTAAPHNGNKSFEAETTGTAYTSANLAGQVSQTITQRQTASTMSAPTGQLADCVNRVGNRRHPVLVDRGSYDGRPATVIVFSTAAQPDQSNLDIWVVGPGCAADSSDVIKHAQPTG